ncbi:unnamed protein product [Paramecium pentaurelia]|uniref:Protein kinase domain-containing protein n=1 Tax=Paramecium pentaurelia TaxID=43138 RepID=A0A8S1X3I0_9CILI|nr:unnamed protein product [Paramecium pentaurelia]
MEEDDSKVNDWIIVKNVLLGKGTFGKVLRCHRQDNPNELFCIKIISKFNIALRDDEINKSISNEKNVIQILAQAKEQAENIVQIIELIDKPQNIYIIMELCDHDLQKEFDLIKPNWFTIQEQIDIIQQIIKGACFLKDNQLIHRDIKPQNILVKIVTDIDQKKRKIFKIADFGLSRTLENMYQKRNLTLVGSKNYYAPEIYYQIQFSAKCDIYSYGLLFYQIAFQGKLPFDENEGQMEHFDRIKNTNFKCNKIQEKYGDLITDLIEKMVVFSEDNRIGFEELQKHNITNLQLNTDRDSIFIPICDVNTEQDIQAKETRNQKQISENIYKIMNIYYRKFLLCQHIRDHLKSKFQTLDQYLKILLLLIGWIGFIQIKHAFSLIKQIFTDFEGILAQSIQLPLLLQYLKTYREQVQKTEQYQMINQTIQQTYYQFNIILKNEFNALLMQIYQDTNKMILQKYQKNLEQKIQLIKRLEIQNINCNILYNELNDLMNIEIYQNKQIFDQKDLDLIKSIENLQKKFQIVDYITIDVNQIFDPNQN